MVILTRKDLKVPQQQKSYLQANATPPSKEGPTTASMPQGTSTTNTKKIKNSNVKHSSEEVAGLRAQVVYLQDTVNKLATLVDKLLPLVRHIDVTNNSLGNIQTQNNSDYLTAGSKVALQ